MGIIQKLSEGIGNTPLLQFDNTLWNIKEQISLYGKLETYNPGGSIKDRTVFYMFQYMEEEKMIQKGSHIVDVDAGNTGVAMAWLGAEKGYRITVILPDNYVIEKQVMMRALGANVLNYRNGNQEEAKELLKKVRAEDPSAVFLNQYHNLKNFRGHEEHTAEEIYFDLNGKVDVFLASAGTGGSFTGIAKYLKNHNPATKTILLNPIGSIYSGKPAGKFKVAGVGNHFFPENLDLSLADEIVDYKDTCAHEMVKELAKKMGLMVGTASGLNVYGALEFAKNYQGEEPLNIVTLLTDDSWRYFSEDIYGASNYVEIRSKLLME